MQVCWGLITVPSCLANGVLIFPGETLFPNFFLAVGLGWPPLSHSRVEHFPKTYRYLCSCLDGHTQPRSLLLTLLGIPSMRKGRATGWGERLGLDLV